MGFIRTISTVFTIFVLIFNLQSVSAEEATPTGPTPEELRRLIEEKNIELQALGEKRQEVEENLDNISAQSRNLQREVQRIDYQINQVNLSIKSNEITIEKLGLELQELSFGIKDAETQIVSKKESIGKLIREMQKKDDESLLAIILKNGSLADSLAEAQALIDLNGGLSAAIIDLREVQQSIALKLKETDQKKYDQEREKTTLANRRLIALDQKNERQGILSETKNQEKIYQQQLAEIEKRQEEIGQEIEEVEKRLRESFDPSLLPVKRGGVLGYPVGGPYVTQEYGATKFAQLAYKTKFHNGIDFRAPLGTPILAAADGKVLAVDNNDRGTSRWNKYQYGKYIVIEHENNLATLYAHLSKQLVKKGDVVKKGDIIGYSGNTGYSTGAHLHFTVYWAPSIQLKSIPPAAGLVPIGVTIDPEDYL